MNYFCFDEVKQIIKLCRICEEEGISAIGVICAFGGVPSCVTAAGRSPFAAPPSNLSQQTKTPSWQKCHLGVLAE